MNRFLQVFMAMFVAFLMLLVLNVVDQMNTPLVGNWALITNNFIGIFPYLMLIFLGFFYVLRRG